MSTLQYIKHLIEDKNIASITPTSQSVVREVCNKLNFDQKMVIVEYGPATGVFTKHLLQRLSKDSILITIELNKSFVDTLQKNFNDPRLKIHHDHAENVDAIIQKYLQDEGVDCVISGIPFSLIPPKVKSRIIQKTYDALKKDGKFLAYQTFFQKNHQLKDYLTKHFATVQNEIELKNIPPLKVYEASR